MILHRRIHKFINGRFDEGVELAKTLNGYGQTQLKCHSKLYTTSIWGGSQPRPRLIVDTQHDSLTAMEKYFQEFLTLSEVQELLPRWQAVEEESWAENYEIISD